MLITNSAPAVLTPRRKTLILVTCCLSLFIVSMDATIVNVAIPSIRHDLGASVSQAQWLIDVYTLVLAGLLLLAGATADRFGRKRMFRIGLATFAAASLLCSVAPNAETLIGARLLQGIGGSMLNPVAMSIITQVFTGRRERARAIGAWGAVVGISMALGPIVGGALIDVFDWRAVFWLNVPICLIAFVLTTVFVPESRSATARGIDPVGQILAIVFMCGLVFGLIEAPSMGWADPRTIAVFAVSVLAFVAFLFAEKRHHDPFIDLRFFRSVPFAAATLVAVFAFATFGAFLFLTSIYLQTVRGFSAVHTGTLYLAIAVGTLLFSPLSGRLVGRYGTRIPLLVAGVLLTAAALAFTTLTPHTSIWFLLAAFAVFGIGFGMANPPITNSAVSGMPLDRAGAAAAVASTSRQVGVSIGVALCGSIAGHAIADPHSGGSAFTDATAPLWWTMAGLTASIIVLAVVSTGAWARRTSERVAPLLASAPTEHISEPARV